jgi:hypothetical protein
MLFDDRTYREDLRTNGVLHEPDLPEPANGRQQRHSFAFLECAYWLVTHQM